MSVISIIALVLVIIGALNWGFVGLFNFDLVSAVFGNASGAYTGTGTAARIVFIIVAIAGLWCIPLLFRREDRD